MKIDQSKQKSEQVRRDNLVMSSARYSWQREFDLSQYLPPLDVLSCAFFVLPKKRIMGKGFGLIVVASVFKQCLSIKGCEAENL